jgi:hypothetical protein
MVAAVDEMVAAVDEMLKKLLFCYVFDDSNCRCLPGHFFHPINALTEDLSP